MKSLFQIEIPRRSRSCSDCGKGFERDSEYLSKLQEVTEGGYERLDFCLGCWNKEILEPKEIYWKSKVPSKDPLSNPNLKKEQRALSLFRQNITSEPENFSPEELFVLALYLARKKVLLWRQEIQTAEGKPAVLVEIAETEEMLGIPKIDLESIDIATIQQKLAERLNPSR